MKNNSVFKQLLCLVAMAILATWGFFTPAMADYKNSVNQHGKCMDEKYKEKEKCNKILGKAYAKISGGKEDWKGHNTQLDMAMNCHNQAEEDFDRCTDPKILRDTFKGKVYNTWRKKNKKELKTLADQYEAAGDVCSDKTNALILKCAEKHAPKKGKKISEKKMKKAEKGHAKCIASVKKKDKKCFKAATKKFLKGIKKLNPPK